MSYEPGARVVWVGTAMGQKARVVVEGKAALPQVLVLESMGIYGTSADMMFNLAVMTNAVVALSAPAPAAAREVYELLEAKALVLDDVIGVPPSDALRDVMDTVWQHHLSADDRAALNARGDVSRPPGRVGGGEDGGHKA